MIDKNNLAMVGLFVGLGAAGVGVIAALVYVVIIAAKCAWSGC